MCISAAFTWGILLLSIASLTDAYPPAQTLQQEHPSFGRCTADDIGGATNTRNTSFLQDDASSASDEECMLLLSEHDSLFANALSNKSNQEEGTGIRLTSASTSEDVILAATEMIRQRCTECTACTLRNFKKHLEMFSNAAKESTVVVLGLGLHVHAFSKMAKNVVVVETDYSFCRSFLRSKAGSCVMQANVHIYCTRPNSSLEDETGSRGVQQHFYAAQELIRDLIKQQFGDVPQVLWQSLAAFQWRSYY
uniref:Uncharacterized protein n=1 Tax=Eimeria tenella TaxID=5802 RepID=H9B9I7_EIMTE|nr:hypothetical protein [Eimeria tenella]